MTEQELESLKRAAELQAKAGLGELHACRGSHKDRCICGMIWSKEHDVPVFVVLTDEKEWETYNLGAGFKRESDEYKAVLDWVEATGSAPLRVAYDEIVRLRAEVGRLQKGTP